MEAPRALREEQDVPATVHTAPRDISVHHVARLMKARGVKTVVVMDGPKPVGIVTGRDIVVRGSAPGLVVTRVTVGEIMSSPLVTAAPSEDIAAAIARMECHSISRLPILDEAGRLVTLLTMDGLLRVRQPALVTLADLLQGQPRFSGGGSQTSLDTPAITLAELGAPAIPPVRALSGTSPPVVHRVILAPMIKRRRWTRVYFAVRVWYQCNAKWLILLLVLAVAGAGIALVIGAFYGYKPFYYEPKDMPRGEHLEKQQQQQQKENP